MKHEMPNAEPGVRCSRHPSRALRTLMIFTADGLLNGFLGFGAVVCGKRRAPIRAPVLVHSWCNARDDLRQTAAILRKGAVGESLRSNALSV
jgi:hypothetical protein